MNTKTKFASINQNIERFVVLGNNETKPENLMTAVLAKIKNLNNEKLIKLLAFLKTL